MAYDNKGKKKEETEVREGRVSATSKKMARLSQGTGLFFNRPNAKGDNLNREHPSLKF